MMHPIFTANYQKWQTLPDRSKAQQWIEDFFQWLFCLGQEYADYEYFNLKEKHLKEQFSDLLSNSGLSADDIIQITGNLDVNLVLLHDKLEDDLKAIFEFDPAAKSRN